MVTFADPAHFMSKSAAPPLECLAPTGNSTGGWPVCTHPPLRINIGPPPPAPGHADPAIRAKAHCTMLEKLCCHCAERNMIFQ